MNNIDEIDEKFNDLQTILNSSKEFSFEDGTILKLILPQRDIPNR